MVILHEERQWCAVLFDMPRELGVVRRRASGGTPAVLLLHALHRDPRDALHVRHGERGEDLARDLALVLLLGRLELALARGKSVRSETFLLRSDARLLFAVEPIRHFA